MKDGTDKEKGRPRKYDVAFKRMVIGSTGAVAGPWSNCVGDTPWRARAVLQNG
ncbi:MAG: hypothetical protein IPI81_01195 [Flavobacteriales bacterium]|nr:hypothetical protein [Flavobacteriales bacterium]